MVIQYTLPFDTSTRAKLSPEGGNLRRGSVSTLSIPRPDEGRGVERVDETSHETILKSRLEKHLKKTVNLVITNNSSTYLTALDKKEKGLSLRLHKMFLDAGSEVVDAVAKYITRRDKDSSSLIDGYIKANKHQILPSKKRTRIILSKGRWFDLREIYDSLNRRYFGDKLSLEITWGRASKKKRWRQIQLGSFSDGQQLITIHPYLDQVFVPKFVTEYVVYHEMCHGMLGNQEVDGRRQIHGESFIKLEKKFEKYNEARFWEEKNISKLISSAKRFYRKSNFISGL